MSGMYVCFLNTLLTSVHTIYFMFNTASLVEHPIHRVCGAFVGYKTAEVYDVWNTLGQMRKSGGDVF